MPDYPDADVLEPEESAVDAEAVEPEATEQAISPEQTLALLIQAPNIAVAMADDPEGKTKLSAIAAKVIEEYEIDLDSRNDWIDKNHDAMKLAMMVTEEKNYPFPKAANIKYPLIATAALQFNARAYPAIVAPDRVVKCKVRGRDVQGAKAARADRVSEHMSDQLLNGMPEWEADTDRLTIILPIEGSAFRKVWFDPALRRNVSRLIKADNFVVNYWARSIEDAPRKTEKLRLYPYEIQERILDGRFMEFDYALGGGVADDSDSPEEQARGDQNDDSAPHLFLEQHRLLDLDEDGYPEPYIVTVHKATETICRIVANFSADTVTLTQDRRIASIRPESFFVHYQFMPNPDGGFYGLGLGWLLSATNETINSTLNMMMDAGHLASTQGGLISSVLGLREKSIQLKMGEWRVVNTTGPINQAIMPIKYDGPNATLFQLLGLMIEAGKELASTKDVLTGDTPATAPVGTTLALIEQGLQVFTSIYKRVHRTLKFEFQIMGRLNGQHVTPEEYAQFFDEEGVDPKADYDAKDMDILPVSDPQSVTKMQKLAKAQLVLEASKEAPFVDQREAMTRFFEAADVEDVEKLIPPPSPPDPEIEAMAKRAAEAEVEEMEASSAQKFTAALKNLADAEAAEAGSQMGMYGQMLAILQAEHGMEMDINDPARQGGLPGMEGQPADPMGVPAAPAGDLGAGAGPAGPVAQLGGPAPAAMGAGPAGGGLPQGAL
jgi:chaperonin GroES